MFNTNVAKESQFTSHNAYLIAPTPTKPQLHFYFGENKVHVCLIRLTEWANGGEKERQRIREGNEKCWWEWGRRNQYTWRISKQNTSKMCKLCFDLICISQYLECLFEFIIRASEKLALYLVVAFRLYQRKQLAEFELCEKVTSSEMALCSHKIVEHQK